LAVILGLVAVRHLGLSRALAVESAAAKIERVLPDELREQARALQGALTLNMPVSPYSSEEMLATASLAAYQHNQTWIAYQGLERSKTERVVDVYGLVYQNGFWYAIGYCHLREDIRIFRLDRVLQIKILETTFESPQNFDSLTYLLTKIATIPYMWLVEVLLKVNLQEAQRLISQATGLLEEVEGGVVLRMGAEDLGWAARFLVNLNCAFTVIRPAELRDELHRLAQLVSKLAENTIETLPT
jgi:predicted DNA-binding transcriptional regulator YafY